MNIGLTGLVAVAGSSNVGRSGKPVRVYDIAVCSSATVVDVYNGTSIAGVPVLKLGIDPGLHELHSNVGLRFTNGCFVNATGGTAHINYIEEF